jgi:hypothetical protein
MGLARALALLAGAAATVAVSGATAQTGQVVQKVTGPVAVYWMSAQTETGFGLPSGGNPDPMAMMRQMMGGGGAGSNKSLTLQLGSSQTNSAPSAEHLPPQSLALGTSLPLITPKFVPSPPREPGPIPRDFQKPRGRLLIFWGCGERARPGQPVVIDFAKLAAGQVPAGLNGIDFRNMSPPSVSKNRTYGDWPNEKTRNPGVPSQGSLLGEHTIRGNYSPQMNFTLEEDQDFLGPLNLTTNAKAPGGWTNIGWNLVGNAQAYFAIAVGGGGGGSDDETVVLWSSSEAQAAAFVMPDYLAPSEINRQVAAKALMGPATRSCTVPKEVVDAAPQALLQLAAFGGEANFVYPPRPENPRIPWNQEWAVKVRYRSATGGLLGMDMNEMMGGRAGRSSANPQSQKPVQPPKPAKPPSAADILRKGILGGGLPFPR